MHEHCYNPDSLPLDTSPKLMSSKYSYGLVKKFQSQYIL